MSDEVNKKVRLYVFVGAYGSGKSEVSVHFAHMLKQQDPKANVMIADLDIVNPYYRSADAKEALEAEGIRVIVPEYANTNVDVPALSGEVYSAFDQDDAVAVFDIGGEDLGARVLGAMLSRFKNIEYRVYMVVNAFRPFTSDPEGIKQMCADQIVRWYYDGKLESEITSILKARKSFDDEMNARFRDLKNEVPFWPKTPEMGY